jgi:DNA-binding XRE family transcriptional regulator
MRSPSAEREPVSVGFLSSTTPGHLEVGVHDDERRRRRLATFFLNNRRRIDANVARVGTYARRQSRVGRPLTQEEVAEALDVSRQWYAALENGWSIRPSAALLDRIATFFDLHVDDRLMLFRLAIPEFGISTRHPGP